MLNLNKYTKTKYKPKQTYKFKNCSHVWAYHCGQLSDTIQYRTVVIIFSPNLQTIITALMLLIGEGRSSSLSSSQSIINTSKVTNSKFPVTSTDYKTSKPQKTRVSAAADRPARGRGSAHAKYSISHHMVIKPFLLLGLAAEYRSRQWVWSTVVRRPSEVNDTHRQTKLTVSETISCSRDIVGAHQNLNGSRDITMPLSRMVCHLWASTCYRQPTYQNWSLYLHSLRRYERRHKRSKWGG